MTTDREDHLRSGRTELAESVTGIWRWVAAAGRTCRALQAAAQALCEAAR